MSGIAVADTHVVIWYLYDDPILSPPTLKALNAADNGGFFVYVSTITLIEVTFLTERGRLNPDVLTTIEQVLVREDTCFRHIPIDRAIATAMKRIPRKEVPEMPDRIIGATALHLGLPLITRDLSLHGCSAIQTIW